MDPMWLAISDATAVSAASDTIRFVMGATRRGAAASLAVVALLAAGCSTPMTADAGTSSAAPSHSAASTAPPTALPTTRPTPPPPSTRATGRVIATGHGWTAAGVAGPAPQAGSCHLRFTATREALPDPACTPGATDAAVTQANLSTTVCRKGGYTSSVRPTRKVSAAAKWVVLAAYGIPRSQTGSYELDHLIELSAGGASDYRNLWPQPNGFTLYKGGPYLQNDKDAVESAGFAALCPRRVGLARLQTAMAGDWTTLIVNLGLPSPTRKSS